MDEERAQRAAAPNDGPRDGAIRASQGPGLRSGRGHASRGEQGPNR